MRSLSLLFAAAALAGCSTAPQQRSASAEAQLREMLAGRVAEASVSCLSAYRADNMIVIDDSTVLFREGSRIYRNDFNGGSCNGLRSGNALVTKQFGGTGLCRGDIAQVMDVSSGMIVGSCAIGDFVPYVLSAG